MYFKARGLLTQASNVDKIVAVFSYQKYGFNFAKKKAYGFLIFCLLSPSATACLSCPKTRTAWCCPSVWSPSGLSSAPGPSASTSWKAEKCWCPSTLVACWLSSIWGSARTREKPRMHAHEQLRSVSPSTHPRLVDTFIFCPHKNACFMGIVSDCPLLPIVLVSPIK